MILQAPLYDKDCVLGNILAAYYLSSSPLSRANFYIEAAKSSLVSLYMHYLVVVHILHWVWGKFRRLIRWLQEQSTPYEKAVFEVVSYLMSEDRNDDLAFEMHTEVGSHFYCYFTPNIFLESSFIFVNLISIQRLWFKKLSFVAF